MSNKKDFTDGPIYTITNYIFWFLLGNFYFIILNIPIIFLLLGMQSEVTAEYIPLFFLCSIPIGPAFTALLSTMGKLVREKDINITPTFFKAYKQNFGESIFYWCLLLIAFIIFHFDAQYFSLKSNFRFLAYVFQALQIFVLCLGFYMFPIISRFYFKIKDIVKLSIKYFFKKIYVTVLSVFTIMVLWYFVTKVTSFIILFVVSILCYAIMYFENGMLKEIEESIKNNETENKENK